MRLAIFDFCDTLVNFQTANEFSKYVLKKESRNVLYQIDYFFEKLFFYRIFAKFGITSFSQKIFLLRGLKGLTKEKIDKYGSQFFDEFIKVRFNKNILERFLEHKKNNDILVINSGGYDAYLQHFANYYVVDYTFSNKFKYVNDIFCGEILGYDCLGMEKVYQMQKAGFNFDQYDQIYVYSDSITDLPIFNLASHKVAVLQKGTSPRPTWCQPTFEIIYV